MDTGHNFEFDKSCKFLKFFNQTNVVDSASRDSGYSRLMRD